MNGAIVKKKKDPLISIIIPVYNTEAYIDRCLRSVVDQTYRNLEILLIDDGSTDDSTAKCEQWAKEDARIRLIRQENRGAGAARNHGLQLAKGEYIGFTDSDDWIEPVMYEELYKALERYPEADIAECETRRTYTGPTGEVSLPQTYRIGPKSREGLLEDFFRVHGGESNYGIITKLMHRDLLKDFRFLEGTISEDVMASYYFYTHCRKLVKVEGKFYNYFQNRSGVTRKQVSEKDLEYIHAFERIREDIGEHFPEFTKYAGINLARANYTILCKMKMHGFDRKDPRLVAEYREMKTVVRKHFWELMRWKMSLSRKILLLWAVI